jgi:hypothetical protein
LAEGDRLEEQQKLDPKFSLTKNEKKLMERRKKYLQQKEEFKKNNLHLFDGEL